MRNLPAKEDSLKWYKMESRDSGETDVYLFDEIGMWGVTAKSFIDSIKDIKGKIVLHINSPGGAIFEGLAIYNVLKNKKAEVVIEGLAASMAGIIALAGTKVTMARNAMLMIHNPWTSVCGESEDLRKSAEVLDMLKAQMIDIYSSFSGLGETEVSALMDNETWLTAEEAKKMGFCHEISGEKEINNLFEQDYFQNKSQYEKFVAMQINNKTQTEEPMDEILALLGASDKNEAISKIKALKDNHQALKQQVVSKTIEMDVQAKKLLPSQKTFAEKMLMNGEEQYQEYLQSIQKPEDLTKPEMIAGSNQPQAVTYQQLLDNPAEYCRLMKENPALVAELERTQGGK